MIRNNRYFGKTFSSKLTRINWKITLMLTIVPLITSFLYIPFPFSPAAPQTQYPHIVASYLVFKNSTNTTTYAKNGTTGLIDFSGSPYSVVQNATNALPITGGKIVILPGTYNFTTAVTIARNNVWIQGLGGGLDDNTGQGTTLTRGTGNSFFILKRAGNTADLYGFHLSDLALDGNKVSDTKDMIESADFC